MFWGLAMHTNQELHFPEHVLGLAFRSGTERKTDSDYQVVLMMKKSDGTLTPYSFGHKWKDGR